MLFVFVVKQRAYSWLYMELGAPVVGPVWITQMRETVYLLLDGVVAPVTVGTGWVGWLLGLGGKV